MGAAVGIDVHKDTLVIAQHEGWQFQVPRTGPGLADLTARLKRRAPDVVVLEPSGGYERPVVAALHEVGLPVAMPQPRRVRDFIRGQGIAAKSDGLDARMLARFGASMPDLRLVAGPSAAQVRLLALTDLRRTLSRDIVAKTHQRQERSAEVQAVLDRVIALLEQEQAGIEAEIAALIETAPELRRVREVLQSCGGVGQVSAALLLAELPELGQRDAKELAALVGVAPMTQQSGKQPETGHIAGGRRHVRSGLWMATLAAMRCNPVIRAFRDRLRAQGKAHKVVVVACMHKLLTVLNAMVRTDTIWEDRPARA